jgi:hypothetical protein
MDGVALDFEMLNWDEKEFSFSLNKGAFTSDKPLGDAAVDELLAAITADVTDFKSQMTKQTRDLEELGDFPMDPALPLGVVLMATPVLEKIDFDENFVNMGVSLEHFGLLSDK